MLRAFFVRLLRNHEYQLRLFVQTFNLGYRIRKLTPLDI
jgi:hypothetical protein